MLLEILSKHMVRRHHGAEGDMLGIDACTGCPRKFVPRLPEDHDKAAKGRQHILA